MEYAPPGEWAPGARFGSQEKIPEALNDVSPVALPDVQNERLLTLKGRTPIASTRAVSGRSAAPSIQPAS